MNIYFACSITGGREFEAVYQAIVAALLADGHTVPTAHLAAPEVRQEEAVIAPADVYARDVAWIRAADVLIAEVSTPSHGVGYEGGYALGLGKPVLCCYQQGRSVSKMLSGNPDAHLKMAGYATDDEVIRTIRAFLSQKQVHK
jgi:nucleoside 2-deoxyribosyltransferase